MARAETVARTRAEVAARRTAAPLPSFRGALAPSDRPLAAALVARGTGFILECGTATAAGGHAHGDLAAAAVAQACGPHASAISVLTDGPARGVGLRAVRHSVPHPVLCRNLVVDSYQVYEARLHGADAVLLALGVLDDGEYDRCLAAVRELGMEAVTEVHDAEEMARARRLGATLLGIGTRAPGADLVRAERLARLRPPGALLVAALGPGTRADVRRLRPHVDAFLVDTALMGAVDPSVAVRELAYGRVKVCGLTRPADARLAAEAGASWGGLIMAAESPRRITLDVARRVREAEPALRWAGVFVNEPASRVAAAARALALDAVQLHGEEDAAAVAAVRAALPPHVEVWKAERVRESIPCVPGADRVLLDAFTAGARGGTGRTFDWRLFTGVSDRWRFIVSGGLTPERARAADELGAWGLDVCSGVESGPGVKSVAGLERFFAALRRTTREVP